MPDYQKAKIYRIVSNVCDLVYYGSTCETLSRRLQEHRSAYKSYLNGKSKNISSYEVIEKGNYQIILVENYPCNSREELKARERFYIENNNCVNKCIPGRTYKEYYQDNREKKLEYLKEYREKNHEKILEYFKEYYEANSEKILEQKKEKIRCEICDSEIVKHGINRHQLSLKCQKASIKLEKQ